MTLLGPGSFRFWPKVSKPSFQNKAKTETPPQVKTLRQLEWRFDEGDPPRRREVRKSTFSYENSRCSMKFVDVL